MRLIAWNCQAAFAKKPALAEALTPDLFIVPECEQLESLTQSFGTKLLRSVQWVGDLPRKGLGVFALGFARRKSIPPFVLLADAASEPNTIKRSRTVLVRRINSLSFETSAKHR